MGIKNFHQWLHEKFPMAFIQIKNNNIYEYIYIDLNFILHNSIYSCRTESEFMNRIKNNLDIIFSNFIATKEIFIAIDGPSSFAKIMLQQKRRLNNTNKMDTTKINSLCITPGISIMQRVEKYIEKYIFNLGKKYKFIKPKFSTSFSNEPNEGEIKICKKVIANGSKNLDHRHLIIGNDSDLIVLAMGMKPVYNINILIKGKEVNEIISLKNLLHAYCKFLNKDNTINELKNSCFRDDFIVLSIMMGNDYLPKVGYINYEKLWKCYKILISKIDQTIINNDTNFNIPVLSHFLLILYNSISSGYQKVNISTYNPEQSNLYLEGILWCVNMYRTGICPKYDYIYETGNSPHPYELLFHVCSEKNNIKCIKTDFKPIPSYIYPLVVMPRKASYLLNKKQQDLMTNDLNYLYEREECIKCHNLKMKINKIRKQILETEENNNLKEDFKTIEINYKNHIKTHGEFNIDDIHKIIFIFNKK